MSDVPLIQTLMRLDAVVQELSKIIKELKRHDTDEIVIPADAKLPECAPFLEDPPPEKLDPLSLGCRRPTLLKGEEPPIRVYDYVRLCEKLRAWIDEIADITRKHADAQEPPGDQR